ncbi:recombinase family protein [Methanococcoides alaskense]|uniref:Site-specific DNA recombinase n=1 Tax=Methanococcoides alaskense TaxID=325778 RepID=A0AA90U0X4_9EURY|nr:recombinase family protein [Methanococcoides alaskense]MDA0524215.1 recombinase family protein [Methanococcoides alaskense]MDR6223662.1 site-specific DNA recombinase [Methanococcoides alaskense]
MKNNTIKKAGLYIRTSTDNQQDSIHLQRQELRNYCHSKGWVVHEEYIDFGFSGKDTERPAFQNIMQDAEDGKFQILLVTKIDRFARSIIDCLVSVEKLESYCVSFAATSQPIDTSSAMGKLTLQIMASFAEFERSIINERMTAGRRAAEQRGVICHRPKKEIPSKKLEELIEKGLSANACGKYFGVTASTITNRLINYGYVYENGEWKKEEH